MNASAGVDIGSATTKVAIVRNGTVLATEVVSTGYDMSGAANNTLDKALALAGLSRQDLGYIISTGYGRRSVSFANETITEITCHAKGAYSLIPETRTIIDIGGQDNKVIWLNDEGVVTDFSMNDKCAAGTGRYLELVSRTLDLTVEELGQISLQSGHPEVISATCVVFAESEVVTLRASGARKEDIAAGIHLALAQRMSSMASHRGFRKEVVFTGGVAKNVGMIKAMSDKIGFNVLIPKEPQIAGALGAALLAAEANQATK